jgi:hypothetical protein
MLRDGESLELNYFLVAFLDILGQREKLRRLTGLPGDLKPDARMIETVRATFGAVHGIRGIIDGYLKAEGDPGKVAHLMPEDKREALMRLLRSDAMQYGFSDSIVVAVSLKGEPGDSVPINGVSAALHASCSAAVTSLACGHALRGGIDVGVAAQISETEVYGPALERAYVLEHSAEYPRILIGAELWNYLNVMESVVVDTQAGRYTAEQARAVKRLIYADTDRQPTLDFLGEAFRSLAQEEVVRTVRLAHAFVRAERDRFGVAGDTKLSDRYDRLLGYFTLRGALWGLDG